MGDSFPSTMTNRIRPVIFLVVVFSWTAHPASAQAPPSPASFVDPLIGTNPNPYTKIGYAFDTGNVFPGAVCPRGMLAWSPDTTHSKNIAGGYWYPDDKIDDFSLTHFSGRGVPCLKDIAFVPLVQPIETSPGTAWEQYASSFSHQNESASAGYYRVKFDNGVQTELTATPRTGMARFTFPPQSTATLLIRADGSISINGNEVSGHARKVYFFAQFSVPIKSFKTWDGDKIGDAPTAPGGAILTFDTSKDPVVQVRVGISYTSVENAQDNLKQENKDWDFAAVQTQAVALWNHELSRIEIEGGTDDEKKVFYTALYHCFMHPNILDDANGQYLGMDDKVHTVDAGHHQYQNIPAWDEHRSHSPLMAIIASQESSDVMQSLVNYAQQDASARPAGGGMPRWEQMNINSGGMVGDCDDSIVATSYAFGATGFDAKSAWEAMDKGASQPGTTSDGKKVRDGLEQYMSLGYVPGKVAVTLEYCNDDFALSQFAKSLGYGQQSAAYLKRAQNWKNLFDPSTGYLRPKPADGTWAQKFSPKSGGGFVEGTAAQYLWLVNFNLRALIDKIGGNDKAVARLDYFFTKTNDGLSSEFAYMGNEPCEETPWVYDFASAPWRTQEVVRRIQTELFTTQPSGIPGNDDAGSLSSWYVFSALGLYPEIPGVAGLVVGSPVFPKATLHMENGKSIRIIGEQASLANPYVQSLKVNDQSYESPWIPWSLLSNGGVLDFNLGDKPSSWGSDPSKAPPSFDSE
jgi:predicted alpha-1,2-mannosidase